MPIIEKDMPLDVMKKRMKDSVCKCGTQLTIAWGGGFGYDCYILRCAENIDHNEIMRPYQPSVYEIPGFNLFNLNKGRKKIVEQNFGQKATALAKYHGVLALRKAEALEILQTAFPDAPEKEMTRAVLLCTSYHLNPLMGHVFLIPFNKGKSNESWATVIGIKAKRLLASRRRAFSYLDDSPRIMTEKEQIKVFGKVDEKNIVGLTVLQDPQTRAIARGYGKWEKGKEPYGTDKGNSQENMVFIRSESQALDRLCPGEMPMGVGVVDEQFLAEKDSIIEGEFKEVAEEAKEKSPPTPLGEEAHDEQQEPQLEGATLDELKEALGLCNWTETDLGHYIAQEKKWQFTMYKDLTPTQIKELIDHINKNPK